MNRKDMTKKQIQAIETKKRSIAIQKQKDKLESKLRDRIESTKCQYDRFLQNAIEKQKAYYDRKKQIQINKVIKSYKNKQTDKIRSIRKLDKKIRISNNIRSKAIEEFQLFAKLQRADNQGMLFLVDKGIKVHRSDSVAGHFYPKSKYPHMIFMLDNVWPITSGTNYEQLDNIGYIREKQLTNVLGELEMKRLKDISIDKYMKSLTRSHKEYKEIYTTYKEQNAIHKKRLGKYYKKNLLNYCD